MCVAFHIKMPCHIVNDMIHNVFGQILRRSVHYPQTNYGISIKENIIRDYFYLSVTLLLPLGVLFLTKEVPNVCGIGWFDTSLILSGIPATFEGGWSQWVTCENVDAILLHKSSSGVVNAEQNCQRSLISVLFSHLLLGHTVWRMVR